MAPSDSHGQISRQITARERQAPREADLPARTDEGTWVATDPRLETMTSKPDRPDPAVLVRDTARTLAEQPEEPPVVARLIVEIRSDGSRTVARGALEDVTNGEKVAVEARGSTPAALAASMIKSLFSGPLLAKVVARRLLRGR